MSAKLFVGPVSKNVVDAVLEYQHQYDASLGLIPSRRQIDYNGGYVNNWTTETFSQYARHRKYDGIRRESWLSSSMYIMTYERDHGGPGQGPENESKTDMLSSVIADARHLDMIHIDTWKKYPSIKDSIRETINIMEFAYSLNKHIKFEVGTEQAIRPMTASELKQFLFGLCRELTPELVDSISYVVIQSGTGLSMNTNIGVYDEVRMIDMIDTVKSLGKKSKEHNGDYLTTEQIKRRFQLGLDSINIAPEFGMIESQCYVDNGIDLYAFARLCYESNKWVKWFPKGYDVLNNPRTLVSVAGHYVFSNPEFIKIKPDCDEKVKDRIKQRIREILT